MRAALWVGALVGLVGCIDSDADGTRDGKDCAPDDFRIHPDAQEVCDGVDNDCNGQVDEGVSITAYWDRDLDGFGDSAYARRVCALPEDGSLVAGDCDDLDPKVHPDAIEVCNLVDDDCDQQFDEDALLTFYSDQDRDGHGVAGDTVEACYAPDGYAATDDDCDDGEPLAWTGATEVCDGVDNDCDAAVDEDLEPVRVWVDDDLDGYGDPSQPTVACGPGSGLSDNALDCDDTDPALSHDAMEVRNNDFDDDCDGYVDEFGVGPAGSNEFQTVEDALASAPAGAVVQLDQGFHVLTVDLTGEDVTFAGEGCDRTTLYADAMGTAVTVDGGAIEQLTISGGTGTLVGVTKDDPGHVVGGGVLVLGDTTLSRVCVDGNTAARGGGVAVMAGHAFVDQVKFAGNSASDWGGGLYAQYPATVDLWADTFVANHAEADGGGGGLRVQGATAWVANTVFAGNTCAKHGCGAATGTYADELEVWHAPTLDLDQVTFHANESVVVTGATGQAIFGESATLSLHNVLITGHPVRAVTFDTIAGPDAFTPVVTRAFVGYADNAGWDETFEAWQVDRIGDRVTYAQVDPTLSTSAWDLRLDARSGFVDAGDPAVLDLDGSVSDLGAFGGPSAPEGWDFGFVGDEDLDGMRDAWELRAGTNRWIDDGGLDPDGDGVTNLEEAGLDTDPFGPDSDDDGVDDAIELSDGGSPTDPRDHAPLADLAFERFTLVGEEVELDASGSLDPNGDPLGFSWTVTDRPATSTANPADPTAATTPFTPDVAGEYTVELTVDDGSATVVAQVVVRVFDGLVVPDDAPTLQEALDSVGGGEAVGVRPGTWRGGVGSDVIVFGLGRASEVVIDGNGYDSALAADGTATVAQLTLTGGYARRGGGLRSYADGPVVLSDVIVTGNRAYDGGGIYVSGIASSLVLRDVVVADNAADHNGGGVWFLGDDVHDSVVAERSRFAANSALLHGGALFLDGGTNGGDANFYLYGCEFLANVAADRGAAWSVTGTGMDLNVFNVTLVGNEGNSLGYGDKGRIAVMSDALARNEVDTLWDGNVAWGHFDGVWTDVPPTLFGNGGAAASLLATWQLADPLLALVVNEGELDDALSPLTGSPVRDRGFADLDDVDRSWSDIGACGGPIARPGCLSAQWDVDADGLSDGWERLTGHDPAVDDSTADLDSDGLDALTEQLAGTHPNRADSDRDGVSDADEIGGLGDPTDDRDHRPVAEVPETLVHVDLGGSTTLDASASTDPDGDPVSFRWTIEAKPDDSALTDADLVGADTATVTVPSDALGVVRLSLVVSAGGADSRPVRVWVHTRRPREVPADYTTIGEAIDAAAPGDEIALDAGTWTLVHSTTDVPLVFSGAGIDATTVTAVGTERPFSVLGGDDLGLRDMTITGGLVQSGGGVWCLNATLDLQRVRIAGNVADNGGGMYLDGCDTTATDLELLDNAVAWTGAGAYVLRGTFDQVGGVTARNRAGYSGGGYAILSTDAAFDNVVVRDNFAETLASAALVDWFGNEFVGSFTAEHLTVTGNRGGGGAIHRLDPVVFSLRHSILADNAIYAVYDADLDHEAVTIDHNGWSANTSNSYPSSFSLGATDVRANPKFIAYVGLGSSEVSDFRLRDDSPMLDLGTDLDPDGTAGDFGATGGPLAAVGWDVFLFDTDGDGMADGFELEGGLDPAVDDSLLDLDGDTLTNGTESDLHTDPAAADTDADGVDDPSEVALAKDPTLSTDFAPTASAGADPTVAVGAAAVITGSGEDPQFDPLTYRWSLVRKPGRSALTDADLGGASTATVTITPDTPGEFVLELVVSDPLADSRPEEVVVHVAGDLLVPEDYPTVDEAIDAAESGAVIDVGPGTFPVSSDLEGKDITVVGAGPDQTILTGEGRETLFVANDTELLVLEGVTLTDGFGGRGGAVWVDNGELHLVDVWVTDSVGAQGGALYVDSSPLTFDGGRLVGNHAGYRGGGLYMTGGDPATFTQVLVADNSAADSQGGGVRQFSGALTLTNCILSDNSGHDGAALYTTGLGSTLTLDHVTATFNRAETLTSSIGALLRSGSGTTTLVVDSLVVGHHGGYAIAENTDVTSTTFRHTMFADNDKDFAMTKSPVPADGVDGVQLPGVPDLVGASDDADWTNDDWALGAASTGIDAGDPAGTLDPDGSAPDLGAFGGALGAWIP
ncbi:MAG: MopE-related protein [Myxococcota bacterium]